MEKKKEVPLLILQMKMNTMIVFIFTLLFLSTPSSSEAASAAPPSLTSSANTPINPIGQIRIFERRGRVGGRMATVSLAGDTFEAGAVMLHPKNYHTVNFVKFLNLTVKRDDEDDSSSFGIWDGHRFVFKTLDSNSKFPFFQKIVSLLNSFRMFFRYGFSLLKMSNFGESATDRLLNYYKAVNQGQSLRLWMRCLNGLVCIISPPGHCKRNCRFRLSPLLIQELVTGITRIKYGQSVSISGLAGAVSLAGSGGGWWAVEGGNWQMAAGLISTSDVELHLNEEIASISYLGDYYELNSTNGNSYTCDISVVATPLDEAYFGLHCASTIPELVGTVENSDIPFLTISVLKQHSKNDLSYRMSSRETVADALLDRIFSVRTETIKINWGAYPHYKAPERFAPFILDGRHLYYVNSFENAASSMETSVVAAKNVAQLILSRSSSQVKSSSSNLKSSSPDADNLHSDL
ncbi:unnamed protein product [Camellia sinensis]